MQNEKKSFQNFKNYNQWPCFWTWLSSNAWLATPVPFGRAPFLWVGVFWALGWGVIAGEDAGWGRWLHSSLALVCVWELVWVGESTSSKDSGMAKCFQLRLSLAVGGTYTTATGGALGAGMWLGIVPSDSSLPDIADAGVWSKNLKELYVLISLQRVNTVCEFSVFASCY